MHTYFQRVRIIEQMVSDLSEEIQSPHDSAVQDILFCIVDILGELKEEE